MAMIATLESLVSRSLAAQQAAEQARKAEEEKTKERRLNTAIEEARTWLGEELSALLDGVQPEVTWGYRNSLESVVWNLTFPEEARLAPIEIRRSQYLLNHGSHVTARVNGKTVSQAEHLLAVARQEWPAWAEEQHRQRLAKWRGRIHAGGGLWSEADYAQALQTLETTWAEVPADLRPELEEDYQARKKALQAGHETAKAREQRLKEITEAAQRLVAWHREEAEPFIQRLRALQEEWETKPFTVYRVKYGIIAVDDEETVLLEMDSFYSLAPEPAEDGFWHTVDGRRIRVMHPASVEEITTTVENVYWDMGAAAFPRLTWRVVSAEGEDTFTVRFPPSTPVETLQRIQAEYIAPQPPDEALKPNREDVFERAKMLLQEGWTE